jgi:ATP/maltotriose-dependent transcriptional regulator MalT
VGHGLFDADRALLILEDENKHAYPVDEQIFQAFFTGADDIRLAILNACQTATTSTTRPLMGLAPRLLQRQLAAVVAMQAPILDQTSLVFTREFYRSLVLGYPVDAAMAQARKGIFQEIGAHRPDWGIPVLFLRAADGQLFQVEKRERQGMALLPPPVPERPPAVPDFVGRTLELAHYVELLQNNHAVVITGMAGVGKTALAAMLAQRVATPEQLFWHAFHEQEDAAVLVWKLAGFLALRGQEELWRMLQAAQQRSSQPPPLETLIDYLLQQLTGQNHLLCLDDFQFVDTDPLLGDFVERLLHRAADGQVSVILISRQVPRFILPAGVDPLRGLGIADTQQLLARRGLSLSAELTAALHANTEGNAQLLTLAIDALHRTRTPAHLIERLTATDNIERYLLNEVDAGLNEAERALMGGVAVLLGYPAPREVIEAILDGGNLRRTLRTLSDRHLLMVSGEEGERHYSQHAIVQAFYYDMLTQRNRRALHARAGDYYSREHNFIEAATHWYHAGDVEAAASTLYNNLRALINSGKSQALYKLQAQFRKDDLNDTIWARLKLAAGRAALLVEDIPTALAELGKALGTNDPYDQAQALYHRAKAYKTISYAESLNHFNRGIALLAELSTDTRHAELLADLYIGKAWLSIEETQDLDQAELNLTKAQTLIAQPDFGRQCDLHNAWAALCVKQSEVEKELDHFHKAWIAASTTQDSERMIITALNLGQAYIWAGEMEPGFDYLQKAMVQATEIGDLRAQGKCHQVMGAGYFFQGQYQKAVNHYRLAYAAYQTTGNQNWLGWVCYDLAEVYTHSGDEEQGRAYFNQATAIAEQLGAQDLHNDLAQLVVQFPVLLRKEQEPCGQPLTAD